MDTHYTDDEIIEAFWHAADCEGLGEEDTRQISLLLAGLCEGLHSKRASEHLRTEAIDARETLKLHAQHATDHEVPLTYVYDALGDGHVGLSTYNAESGPNHGDGPSESGTVIGKPGSRIRFDRSEAERAITILRTFFHEEE